VGSDVFSENSKGTDPLQLGTLVREAKKKGRPEGSGRPVEDELSGWAQLNRTTSLPPTISTLRMTRNGEMVR